MTVRANKPAFNIREKLKSLDYSHVPYEKMPADSIIQYQTVDSSSNISSSSAAYVNLSSATLSFSPKLSNSKLLITFNGSLRSSPTGNNRARVPFRLVRSGTALSGYNFNESLQLRNGNFAGSSVEINIPFHFEVIDTPNTTETLSYIWQFQSLDGAYVDMGGSTYRQTIYEIKQ